MSFFDDDGSALYASGWAMGALADHLVSASVGRDPVLWSTRYSGVDPDATVVVGANEALILDVDADIGTLIVDGGQFIVSDSADLYLSADRVLVLDGGEFRVGWATDLHEHDFTLELTGDNPEFDLDISPWFDLPEEEVPRQVGANEPVLLPGVPEGYIGQMPRHGDGHSAFQIVNNDAYLMAMGQGSAIEIHAADRVKESWTQLGRTAEVGDVWLRLSEETAWEVGDRIAIASSDFDWQQTEERVIVDVIEDGRKVRLDRPLEHRHFGEQERYDNGLSGEDYRRWTVDMRAEVALLSRNVTITGDENAHVDQFGGHIMVMMGADMRIEGAEVTRMGQEGLLGRYGAHWHLSGDASGDYLRNNSFHEIYNKGITLHGVQNTTVHDNVVYGTIGHSYFTEDAAEFGNTITENLGMGTRAANPASALTSADVDHVSTFWIENPNNTVRGNHAAGSDFAGFWYAPSRPHGDSAATGLYDKLTPHNDPIQDFTGNTAHSNKVNLGVEGRVTGAVGETPTFKQSRYDPEGDWRVQDFTAYKSSDRSIWTRSIGGVFTDIKSADNTRATFFSFTSTMRDSVIVGRSDGNAETDLTLAHRGHSIYDGPSGIEDVHFANFNGRDHAIQVNGAGEKSTTHFASGISFADVTEANKVDFSANQGAANFDYMWATSLIDVDGSISGIAGATLTAMIQAPDLFLDFADNTGSRIAVADSAIARPDWGAWVNSEGEIGWMRIIPSLDNPASLPFSDPSVQSTRYDITRSDGAEIVGARPTWEALVNASVLAHDDLGYRVRFHDLPNALDVAFKGFSQGTSVEYTFENLPSDTTVSGAREVHSRKELAASDVTAFLREGTDLVFHIVADTQNYLLPTTQNAAVLDRSFGAGFRIETGAGNDSPNALADFEAGADPRGRVIAQAAGVSDARQRWGDRADSSIMWDVTANGDGIWGHGNYRLDFAEPQNWAAFETLNIDTVLRGVRAGYEVILRDAEDGMVSLGRRSGGLASIDLSDVEARFLDDVTAIAIRVYESDLTDDPYAEGASARVYLKSLTLDTQELPHFDFRASEDPVTTKMTGKGLLVSKSTPVVGQEGSGGLSWTVAANSDGRLGYGALQVNMNREDWRHEDWLSIDATMTGDTQDYVVFLQDASDGFVRLGEGTGGRAVLNLAAVENRFLDEVERLVVRIREADLVDPLTGTAGSVTFSLNAVDLARGAMSVTDFASGVDPRGTLEAVQADSEGIGSAAGQNWWYVNANGDGVQGHVDYRFDLDLLDISNIGGFRLSGALTGRPVHPEIFLHDAEGGLVSLGRFDTLTGDIDLHTDATDSVSYVDALVFRLFEEDVQPRADIAKGKARASLTDITLLPGIGESVLRPIG